MKRVVQYRRKKKKLVAVHFSLINTSCFSFRYIREMISAETLLEKTSSAGTGHIGNLQGAQDIYGYLEHGYAMLKDEPDVEGVSGEYAEKLSKAVEEGVVEYENGHKVANSVELNILIERSLLDYEMKFGSEDTPKMLLDSDSLRKSLIDTKDAGLLKHYVEILKLGSITDNTNTSKFSNDANNERLVDELLSVLLSAAVHQNVQLPDVDEREMSDMAGRMRWFKACIHRLVENRGTVEPPASKSEIERAFNDLQFAHSYLTKKYEEEVAQHGRYAHAMDERYGRCEALLAQSRSELASSTKRLLELESSNVEMEKTVETLTKEVKRLQTQNNMLTVDALGRVPVASLLSPPNSPISMSSVSAPGGSPASSPNSPVSVSILRAEFLKLMENMQLRHEKELQDVRKAAQ